MGNCCGRETSGSISYHELPKKPQIDYKWSGSIIGFSTATTWTTRGATASSRRTATASSKRTATASSGRTATASSKRTATASSGRTATASSRRTTTASSRRTPATSARRATFPHAGRTTTFVRRGSALSEMQIPTIEEQLAVNESITLDRVSTALRLRRGTGGSQPPEPSHQLPLQTSGRRQEPEYNEIYQRIIALAAMIDQHVKAFYLLEYASFIRQTICGLVFDLVVSGNSDVAETVSVTLYRTLQPSVKDSTDRYLETDLLKICMSGAEINEMIRRDSSKWTVGSWRSDFRVPTVFRDGSLVKAPAYVKRNR
ncbi:hypothetical protein AOQ84DRAFT_427288 [Glonium stellatum]|uniref:Uncharacterized protein n=1 Tax=Glonium stellatum TaxID=574774 RepID=A0A8E2F4V9_9PEZI|nr:hypothetical protein AOQ84DRAFT_427288 [Glonium stellatum]